MQNMKFWLQTTLVIIIVFMPFVINAQDAPQRTLIPIVSDDHTRFEFLPLVTGEAIREYDAIIIPAQVSSALTAELLTTPSPKITELQTPTTAPFEPIDESVSSDQSPKNTPTPIAIPPPANPNWVKIMIGVVLISVIIIVVGVWINRDRASD
ncbi:hypothetical protein ACFLV7_03390 [Chloroflexota bacterium]